MKRIAKQGFTLMELLLVIFIIGILATAAITTFGPTVRQGAWLAEARTNMSRVKTAAYAYYNKYSEYPPDLPTLTSTDIELLDESITSMAPTVNWTYKLEKESTGYKITATKNKTPNKGSTLVTHSNGVEDPPTWLVGQ